jgi:hypothetical protein
MFRPFRLLIAVSSILFIVWVSHASVVETPGCTGLPAKDCISVRHAPGPDTLERRDLAPEQDMRSDVATLPESIGLRG